MKLDSEELMKKEIEIKAEAVTEIVINSDKIEKDANAILDVEILNQYKKKMTGSNPAADLTAVAVNKTEPGRKIVVNDPTDYDTSKCEIGDEIEFTLFHKAHPAVKVVKVVKVGYVATQGVEVAFGEVVMAGEKTEINPGDLITIPVTVKKNGKEVLPDADDNANASGDDLGTAFTKDSLLVVFGSEITAIDYKKADKALKVHVAPTAKPGAAEIKIINDKAVEYKVSFEVKKEEAPAKIVPVQSVINVPTGENFKVEFKLFGDRGTELKWADFVGKYEVKEVDQSPAGSALVGPWDAAGFMPYTNPTASATIGFVLHNSVTAKDVEGSQTTVDVKTDEMFIAISVDTIPSTELAPQTLKAGQKFTVVIQAENPVGTVLSTHNKKWEGVKIGYGGGASDEVTLSRDVQFVNGVAKVELVAKKSTAGKLKVTMPDTGSINAATAQNLTVTEGDIAKLTVVKNGGDTQKLDLEVFDLDDNPLAGYNEKLNAVVTLPSPTLKVTGPAGAVIDSEGNGTIQFAAGKITLELNKDRIKGLYKVELTLKDGVTKVVGEYTEE